MAHGRLFKAQVVSILDAIEPRIGKQVRGNAFPKVISNIAHARPELNFDARNGRFNVLTDRTVKLGEPGARRVYAPMPSDYRESHGCVAPPLRMLRHSSSFQDYVYHPLAWNRESPP